jgi:uncharacterized protein DUF4367
MNNNDQFLYEFREPPRDAFAKSLGRRLSNLQEHSTMNTSFWKRVAIRRMAWALSALTLVLAVTLMVSPAARAALDEIVQIIGGVRIITSEDGTPPPAGAADPVTEVPSIFTTVANAQTMVPFLMPAYVPDGFDLQEGNVVVSDFPSNVEPDGIMRMVNVTWIKVTNTSAVGLSLSVGEREDIGLNVGHNNNAREVLVNGQPAVLYRGSWNADTGKFTPDSDLNLAWKHGGLFYWLMAAAGGATEEDLIRMAESIP